jgi:hypothetical protein
VAILVGVLLLGGDAETPPGGDSGGAAVSALPGRPGAATGAARPSEAPAAAGTPLAPDVQQITRRIAAGEEIEEADWTALAAAGLAETVRGEVAAALLRGEPGEAAEAVRRALSRVAAGKSASPAGASADSGWDAYGRALQAPVWSPRYDEVVRRYFTGAGQAGLR